MTIPTRRIGMLGLGLGYFLWYAPYSAVAKAMSTGLFHSTGGPVGGFRLLPAAALGTLLAMPVTLTVLGWWKHARHRSLWGLSVPWPGRETLQSAFWMAIIVGTTTLNFTFPGGSILLMLVLMRISTLIIAPGVDLARRREIPLHSWVAVALSLLSAVVALSDVKSYRLGVIAILSVLAYMGGYLNRFLIMSRHAKGGDLASDQRYLVEEHMATPVFLVLILGAAALFGSDPSSLALRDGFTTFLALPGAWLGLLIGVFYEGLFIFTTLIFLDRREYSFCMPVHVCSSLLAGVAASLVLHRVYGVAPPSAATFGAAVCVVFAALALSYPALKAWIGGAPVPKVLLFVCGGNTVRSPMAAALAGMELSAAGKARGWRVASAGVAVKEAGKPLSKHAAAALRHLEVAVPEHASRALTLGLCAESTAVYCMTRAHRAAVLEMAPEIADRVMCLDATDDIAEPHGDDAKTYLDCAQQIQRLVREVLLEHVRPSWRERITGRYPRAASSGEA